MVISSFSNQTSYENQTKKAITNKFIQEALTEFIKQNLEVFFIENKPLAEKVGEQILINKRSREKSEKERLNIKKTLQSSTDMASRVDMMKRVFKGRRLGREHRDRALRRYRSRKGHLS